MRPERTHFQSLDWEFQIVDRAGGGSEMKDVIDRAGDIDKLGDVVLHDRERRIPRKMAKVGGGAGNQVVDSENFPAAIAELVAKGRSEKSRSSRDYCAHRNPLLRPMFSGSLFGFMIK